MLSPLATMAENALVIPVPVENQENCRNPQIGFGYRREELDISAARRDLGFAPQYGMEEGLRAHLTWFCRSGILSKA